MSSPSRPQAAAQYAAAFALTVSLFAVWGLGHKLFEALMPAFTKAFHLGPYETAFTTTIYSVVYLIVAIPAALFARRLGSKIAILVGLGAVAIGCFTLYPASDTQSYVYFLGATTVMATGWTLLEMAANPLAASLGPEEGFVWRLNFAQSFYPLGAVAGFAIGHWLISKNLATPDVKYSYALAHPYIVLGAVALIIAFVFEEVRFPALPSDRLKGGGAKAFRTLVNDRFFLFAMFAQFCSVVALVAGWTSQMRSLIDVLPWRPGGFWGDSIILLMLALAAGRFAGSALMRRMLPPAQVLVLFSGCGIVAACIGASFNGLAGATALLSLSFFVSIAWPTILGLAIRGTGGLMKPGTALISMAGAVGGISHRWIEAVLPFASVHSEMLLPAISLAPVLAYGLAVRRRERRAR